MLGNVAVVGNIHMTEFKTVIQVILGNSLRSSSYNSVLSLWPNSVPGQGTGTRVSQWAQPKQKTTPPNDTLKILVVSNTPYTKM